VSEFCAEEAFGVLVDVPSCRHSRGTEANEERIRTAWIIIRSVHVQRMELLIRDNSVFVVTPNPSLGREAKRNPDCISIHRDGRHGPMIISDDIAAGGPSRVNGPTEVTVTDRPWAISRPAQALMEIGGRSDSRRCSDWRNRLET
jgi:hypothetical protein